MLIPYTGELYGLCTTDTHLVYKWDDDTCRILFSMTRHGNGMSCHFSSDKAGLRKLREAIRDAEEFIYDNFSWCEMIFANIGIESVERLVVDLSFVYMADSEDNRVYVKVRL